MTKPGHVNPDEVQEVLDTSLAFWRSKTLLVAAELDLFTHLDGRQETAPRIGAALGLHERGRDDLLDALVAMGYLARDGDGPSATYTDTAKSRTLLSRTSPTYIGDVLRMTNARVYPFWANLEEALRTGRPQNETKGGSSGWYEALYADPARLEQFVSAMAAYQLGNFKKLVEIFDFGAYERICDVGGGGAALCIEIAQRWEGPQLINFDLPAVTKIALQKIEAAGLQSRVEAVSGDFTDDELPNSNVIVMGNILHNWSIYARKGLIAKAFRALPHGGVLMTVDGIIDAARRENLHALLLSLDMLVETHQGAEYTTAQFDAWCREAGFERTEVLPLVGPTSSGIAYKP